MGWVALVGVAVDLMEQADRVISFARDRLGASQEDIEDAIARHRAERARQRDQHIEAEWPGIIAADTDD